MKKQVLLLFVFLTTIHLINAQRIFTLTAASGAEPALIEETTDTQAEATLNFDFSIENSGSSSGSVSEFYLERDASDETGGWLGVIQGAQLTCDQNAIYVHDGADVIITDDRITFTNIPVNPTGGVFGRIKNGETNTYTVKIWLVTEGTLPSANCGDHIVFRLWQTDKTTGCFTSNANTFYSADINSGSGNNQIHCVVNGENTITAGSGSEPASVSSNIDTQAESVLNFDFKFTDDGATPGTDTDPTLINTITITQGTGNDVADWSTVIAGAELSDGTNNITGTINAADITFSGISNSSSGDLGYISDNGDKTYTLKVWFACPYSGINEGDNFVFEVTKDNITVEASGSSGFKDGESENSGSSNNAFDITATGLEFVTNEPPSTVNLNTNFPVTVNAIDDCGNVDADFSGSVTLALNSGTGTLSSATGLTQNLSSGTYSWTDVQYNTIETFTIEAQSGTLTNEVSWDIHCINSSGTPSFTIGNGAGAEPATISEDVVTQAVASLNFDFTIQNTGDGNGAFTEVYFTDGAGDDIADWRTIIADAELSCDKNDGTTVYTNPVIWSGRLTFENIEATPAGGNFGQVDAYNTNTYTLKIWLKNNYTGASLGDNFEFKVKGDFITTSVNITNPTDNFLSGATNNELVAGSLPKYTVTFHVTETDGTTPISGATITVGGETLTTDGSGNATIDLRNGDYEYTVTHAGYGDVFGVVTVNGSNITENVLMGPKSDYFRSAQSGNWNDITTWEYSNNGGVSWSAATAFPVYNNSDTIFISSGDTVTITANLNIDQTTIEAGGILVLNDVQLYIERGAPLDFLINGTFIDNATAGNGFSIDPSAFWEYGTNGVIIKTNTSDVTPYANNYKGGNNAKPTTAKWIYRYTGNQVELLADMIYPTLIIENSTTGHYDMPNAFSATDKAPSVLGDLDIGGAGPGTITVYNECEGIQSMWVDGDVIVRTGSVLSNNRSSSSVFGKGVSAQGGDVIIDGTLDFNNGGTVGNLRMSASSPQTITGSGTIDIYQLRIANNTTVTLDMSNTVNLAYELRPINGTFIISSQSSITTVNYYNKAADSGALVLQSDASGTGSLIFTDSNDNGGNPISALATVERYVTNYDWHYMFPTLSAIPTSNYTDGQGASFGYLYSYDESVKDYWNSTTIYDGSGNQSIGGWTSEAGSSNLRTDKGYIYSTSQGPKTISQTGGELYFGDKNFTVYYNTHSGTIGNGCVNDWNYYDGWNLVGNPYASAIDWDEVDKTNIESAVYCYDDTQDKYAYYISGGGTGPYDAIGISVNNGSQYVPSGQGFMVKAQSSVGSGGATFKLQNDDRVHNSQAFWKNNNENKIIPDLIRINIEKDGYTDETVIRTLPLKSGVTEDHDGNFDAHKLFAMDNTKPQIYSISEDKHFAINSIPVFNENKIIPLGVYVGISGQYTINIVENNFEDFNVFLEDRKMNKMIDLSETQSYSFYQDTNDNNNQRFFLHFNSNSSDVNNYINDGILIYPNPTNGIVYVKIEDEKYSEVNVVDITGRLILKKDISGGKTNIDLSKFKKGIYFICIKNNFNTIRKKIILK